VEDVLAGNYSSSSSSSTSLEISSQHVVQLSPSSSFWAAESLAFQRLITPPLPPVLHLTLILERVDLKVLIAQTGYTVPEVEVSTANDLAILPFQPSLHVVRIQLWAFSQDISNDNLMVEPPSQNGSLSDNDVEMSGDLPQELHQHLADPTTDSRAKKADQEFMSTHPCQEDQLPILVAEESQVDPVLTAADPKANQPMEVESQADLLMEVDPFIPDSDQVHAMKCLSTLFDSAAGIPPRHPDKHMSLPKKTSKGRKPLVTMPSKKSPRLNSQEGFLHISLDNLPRKRSRSSAALNCLGLDAVFTHSLDAPPSKISGVPAPIPLQSLQNWVIQCSMPPSEVAEDKLLAEKNQDEEHTHLMAAWWCYQ